MGLPYLRQLTLVSLFYLRQLAFMGLPHLRELMLMGLLHLVALLFVTLLYLLDLLFVHTPLFLQSFNGIGSIGTLHITLRGQCTYLLGLTCDDAFLLSHAALQFAYALLQRGAPCFPALLPEEVSDDSRTYDGHYTYYKVCSLHSL